MYSGRATRALPHVGFPIRTSRHHRLVSISTGLIAAAHVLHRLSAPRHPPCPCSLDRKEHVCCHYGVFKVRVDRLSSGLSKLNSDPRRGRRTSRRPGIPDGKGTFHQRARSLRSNGSGFPRKEVIQPQLPLRLPCYDFTPVTNPTFDGSLPCGLGHRLRVLPASMV